MWQRYRSTWVIFNLQQESFRHVRLFSMQFSFHNIFVWQDQQLFDTLSFASGIIYAFAECSISSDGVSSRNWNAFAKIKSKTSIKVKSFNLCGEFSDRYVQTVTL